jgi:myo-inositol-1(or 4)-monophosphatase
MEKRELMRGYLEKFMTHVRQPRALGSAASDLCLLAEGNLDGYINTGLNPWDVAAGVLIVEKAGGKVTLPTGDPYDIFQSDLLVSNRLIHEKFLALIK